ncbi:MAG TPA: ArgE/DapE family deacylase [Candidatus Methylomirabilis sp.]|nr:ArgE/DapE family deacylase [Candidatus Methylomirabilis sp.]
MPPVTIDATYLVRTLADLIRINSVNPSLVSGAPGEAQAAVYVKETLHHLGLDVTLVESVPGRPSVIGILRGTGGGRSLMLNGHLDTVGVDGMSNPFIPRIQNGRMYGRGAFDMKGGLVACLGAVKALVEAKPALRGNVVIAAVADEEYASIGTADVASRVAVDGAIVAEPTTLDLCIAHKGFVWLEVETTGRAAHGSRFHEGIDANIRMGRVLAELDRLEQELRARPPHPLVGPPSLHAAVLQGGTELSTYAARCNLKVERRTIPGETLSQVEAEFQAILDRFAAVDPTFRASLQTLLERRPFEISPDAPLVQAIHQSALARLGRPPAHLGVAYWMDTAILSAAGAEAAAIGPSGAGAHTVEEWVDLQSVEDVAVILAQTAASYCQ